jgi:hypothetical protein
MKNHVKNNHGEGNDTQESTGRFSAVLTNLSSERHYKKTVSIGDELFYVVWKIKDGSFFCAVLYVGPKNNSSRFKYTFSITADNGLKKISMIFQTHSVVKNMEHVFTPGNCVLLHYDTVLKFLNSNKYLLCDFEIIPVETVSDAEKNNSKSVRNNAVKSGNDCFKDRRGLAGKQMSQFESGFSGRARRGRGPERGRFVRGGRHGSVDRSVESRGECNSKANDFQRRSNLGKHSKMNRSVTDLHDGENYQAEMDTLLAIVQDTRLKVNSSSVLSPAKSGSGLDKSQDNVRKNIPKVKSSASLSEEKVSKDKLTKVTELEKSQNGIEKSDLKVKSPSREKFVVDSALGKSQNFVKARPSSNMGIVKCAPSQKPNNIPELGKSQDDFQARVLKVSSPSRLTTSTYAFSDQVTNTSESSKARDKIQKIYPKLDSSYLTTVDDCAGDYSSPFDALHDQANANDAKVKSSPNAPNVRDARNFGNDDWFQDLLPTNKQTDTSTPSSKNTWLCFMCGRRAPLKKPENDLLLLDIESPGANGKCKLCGQWWP